jgi:hypothetical protein
VHTFLQKHQDKIIGVLSGLDRIVFRGTIRQLAHVEGLHSYLACARVLLKNFAEHAESLTTELKTAVIRRVEAMGRPVIYLRSTKTSKEDTARSIAEKDGITRGTICLLTCVEPCQSFVVYRCRESKHLELRSEIRRCLFLYHYFIDPLVGFGHARIQSWFPFRMQIALNGREWLAQQMDRAAMRYCRRDNCFTWIENITDAQQLMNQQLQMDWRVLLGRLSQELNPEPLGLFGSFRVPYYWSTYQSEWATDFMFRNSDALAHLYPRLLRHGIANFGSRDVLRFLGRNLPAQGTAHPTFQGEVMSNLKQRPEGVRIKHSVKRNSIKMYDKQGSVLRIETTINDPRDFKVYRPKEGDDHGRKEWRRMRQGIADLHRRCEVSHAANDRYSDALAAIEDDEPLGALTRHVCRPVRRGQKRFRALRLWHQQDHALLRAINRAEFVVGGFRNRQLRTLLYHSRAASPEEERRRSAFVSRLLQLLRAHQLIRKLPRTHRYQLTKRGRVLITALLTAHAASTRKLSQMAA